MVWGIVASIVGAATVLSVGQTLLERSWKSHEHARKPEGLPAPDKDFKSKSGGVYEASLWQKLDPKKAVERTKRWVRK